MELLKKVFHLKKIAPLNPPILKTKKILHYYSASDYSNLTIIDKEHGGKIDALNAGINIASADYFISIDADTIIAQNTLETLLRPFLMRPNVVACGGSIGIANNCILENNSIKEIRFPKLLLPALQVVEYLRAFLFGRLGWQKLGGNLVISGAFSLFDKKLVIECGGYQLLIGDDVEIVIRIHRKMLKEKKPYYIEFLPDLVAFTEAPITFKGLAKQRIRWQVGLLAALWKNIGMLFNPFYKKTGLISFPYYVFVECLSPFIEIFGYITIVLAYFLGVLHIKLMLWFFLLAFGFPILLSYICIILQSIVLKWYRSFFDILKMLIMSIFEQLGYRQFLVVVRLWAFLKWMSGKTSWDQTKRTIFSNRK